jgi:Fe-S cluster assembly scaffold protein SufB
MSSFDEELVRSISRSLNEPEWLENARMEAFKEFLPAPPEKNPLYTKYVSSFNFPLEPYAMVPGKSEVDFRSYFEGFLTGNESDIILQGNETLVHAELSADVASKGVKLMPFHDALALDEPLIKRLVQQRLVKSESDKFAAFVNAFFNSGTFVYIPRGVTLQRPLRRMLLLDSPKTAVVDQTFVYAEEQSRLVFLEEMYSKGSAGQALVASTTEVRSGQGAHVDFSSIQLLDDQTTHVSNRAIETLNDSRATVSSLVLGSSVSRSRMNFLLNGRGCLAEGFEIFFTNQKQVRLRN